MEFWGVEVEPGETLKCKIEEGKILHLSLVVLGESKNEGVESEPIFVKLNDQETWVGVKPGQTLTCETKGKIFHLSQAALGESKNKGVESVLIFVNLNDQKLVVGVLSQEKCPQIQYDLVFEKEFELSHSSKNVGVYFCGYLTPVYDGPESEELLQSAANANAVKAGANDEDDSDDDEDLLGLSGESDDEKDEDESSGNEDETPPKKAVVSGQKRAPEPASETSAAKKAKALSSAGQKTGKKEKKGVHTAAPDPAKHAGRIHEKNDKSKQQSPNSAGSATCKPCNRSFNSDNALQDHNKAKHSAAK